MKKFLLTNRTAERLYETARTLPVIDWHNHLSARDIAEDAHFRDLTELWVESDPYKHRAMRICGVPERLITGDSAPFEKFAAWSETLPQLAGNPLPVWSLLELSRVFGIDRDLTPSTAKRVWEEANEQIRSPEFSARALLRKFRVEYAAPCTPLTDRLEPFGKTPGLAPSLRGDGLLTPSANLLHELGTQTGIRTDSFDAFRAAAGRRLDAFHAAGCRFADHALDSGFHYQEDSGKDAAVYDECWKRGDFGNAAAESALLRFFAGEYAKRGWVMQLHLGAVRNTSTRLRSLAGPAGGYAGIGKPCDTTALSRMLNDLESGTHGLPRVILYTLNPADYAAFAVLSGSFPGDGVSGKVQLGPAWWFCDHIHGIRECLEAVAAYGVLSLFCGMTTDSRSLLSFVRHEYFRRFFCEWLGKKQEGNELLCDYDTLEQIVKNVCFDNAAKRIAKEST